MLPCSKFQFPISFQEKTSHLFRVRVENRFSLNGYDDVKSSIFVNWKFVKI